MSHQGAMTMLASTQMLDETYGVVGGDVDPTANMAKADKYEEGQHEAAKLMEHIKGGDITADNAETMFTDQADDSTPIGSGSLCKCVPPPRLSPIIGSSRRRILTPRGSHVRWV